MKFKVTAQWVVEDRETALRLGEVLLKIQGAAESQVEPIPDRPDGFHRGCSRETCECHVPGPVCNDCMCADGMKYCPRCGWEHRMHTHCERPQGVSP